MGTFFSDLPFGNFWHSYFHFMINHYKFLQSTEFFTLFFKHKENNEKLE